MFITELFEAQNRNLIVVYAGRFQPFHKGHQAVYNYLLKHYGRDNVYIATSNKIDPPKSPFGFADKTYFMKMMGIPMDRVIESSQPYKAQELTSNYDKDNTVFLIAVSQKDMAEDPRFKVGPKKDGNPSYFQNLPTDLKNAAPMSQHGYLVVVPTFDFEVLGQPMRSATEIRAMYGSADEPTRREIIQDLFGAYTQEAQQIMDSKLGVKEGLLDPGTDTISPIHGGTVTEGDVVAFTPNKKTPPNYEQALRLMKSFLSFDETVPDYNNKMNAILAQLNQLGYSVQSTLDPSHNGLDLVNKSAEFRQFFPYKLQEAYPKQQASVYNPDGATYRGEKMPSYSKDDVYSNSTQVDHATNAELRLGNHELDDPIEKTQQKIDLERLKKVIRAKVEQLTRIETIVLNLRYWQDMTLDQIGKAVNLSVERIRQIEAKALRKLRHPSRNLKQFVDPEYRNPVVQPTNSELKVNKGDTVANINRISDLIDSDRNKVFGESASGYIPKNSKEARDPRWSNALTVDVRPDTVKKAIKAFYPTKAAKTQLKQVQEDREPYQQAIDNLEWALIQKDRDEIDSIRNSIKREKASKDPNQAVIDAWNRKIDKLHDRIKDSLKLK